MVPIHAWQCHRCCGFQAAGKPVYVGKPPAKDVLGFLPWPARAGLILLLVITAPLTMGALLLYALPVALLLWIGLGVWELAQKHRAGG